RKYKVPAVETAFKILTLLSEKKYEKSTLTEIANQLSLSPTTCYRILQQLEELSVVRNDKKTKRYSLCSYLVALGESAKENLFDLSTIIPFMNRLSDETGLTSVLVSRIGRLDSIVVATTEGTDYSVFVSVRSRFSGVEGAYGKCLLAYMEEEES